jgi:hypothetical protein
MRVNLIVISFIYIFGDILTSNDILFEGEGDGGGHVWVHILNQQISDEPTI